MGLTIPLSLGNDGLLRLYLTSDQHLPPSANPKVVAWWILKYSFYWALQI